MPSRVNNLPITTIVRSKPKVGFEKQALDWLHSISNEASNFTGYSGSDIFEAINNNPQRDFVIILHFDNYENLMRWEESKERGEQIKLGESLFEEVKMKMQLAGLDYWVETKDVKKPPPKWKMAIITIVIIFTLLNTLIPFLRQLLNKTGWPVLLNSLASTVVMVGLMSYLLMPFFTKILSRWLFKKAVLTQNNNNLVAVVKA